ncbi:MAG TPA: RNA polymerase sigma factor [Opitutaceae bacterium]|nr:RNA polymerase sigma factor [Opitutaceae bacterium]HRE07776.1 RNA polymerase sigma factor [Opitutaceae bacterium]
MSTPYSVSDNPPVSSLSMAQWFVREVQPHEAALRAYLRVRFPSIKDIDDLIQETFARILRTRTGVPVRSPKALLFTVARNTAIDQLRREQIVRIDGLADLEQLPVYDHAPGAAEALSHEQELRLLEEAVESLPARCQQILILKKIHGLSYAEIGERLGIKSNTISAQLTIGVLRCRRFLEERGVWKGRKRHE